MIGITELPPTTDQLRKILDMLRDNNAYIIVSSNKYKKMNKQYNKLMDAKNNKLAFNYFMVRGIPIYKGEPK